MTKYIHLVALINVDTEKNYIKIWMSLILGSFSKIYSIQTFDFLKYFTLPFLIKI